MTTPRVTRDDGTVTIAVPSGQTWYPGEIRATSDGRFGVVANGPAKAETEIATLLCGANLEVEVDTSENLTAGLQAGWDISAQSAYTTGHANSDGDMGRILYSSTSGNRAKILLNAA